MSHIFCTQCGHKIEFNHAKPNFCSKCGNSLGGTSKAAATVETPIQKTKSEKLNDDETSIDELPDLTDLKVDIETSSDANTFTFGSLFGENSKPRKARRNGKDVNDFIDEKKRR